MTTARSPNWSLKLLGVAGLAAVTAPSAHAQYLAQGSASWRWEASLDGGASWQGGLVETLHNPRVVLIRAIVGFDSFDTPGYFTGVKMDPYVLTTAPEDDVVSLTSPQGLVSRLLSLGISPVRLPGLLKIDGPADVLPPGEGPLWTTIGQPGHQTITQPIADNPMWAMGFTMLLANSPGDRIVQAAFRDNPSYPGRPLFVETRPWLGFGYAQTLEQFPVTIRVVPSPPATVVALVALSVGSRRRR